jgi:hypothetical protein
VDDVRDFNCTDAQRAPPRQTAILKNRRRPGRNHGVPPSLISLLRNPTEGLVAGNLVPIDSFQIAAAWVASAYPDDVWLRLSAMERSAAIYRELRKLDEAHAAREFDMVAELTAKEDR